MYIHLFLKWRLSPDLNIGDYLVFALSNQTPEFEKGLTRALQKARLKLNESVVSLRSSIAEELPGIAHLSDLIEIEISH